MAGMDAAPDAHARAVFRPPQLTVLFAVTLAVCMIPVATAGPWLWLLFAVPVGIVVWVLRVRTVVDGETVTVRRVVGSRRVPWAQISSLRIGRGNANRRARVHAVLTGGDELPLPAVHVRDLPQLAAVSGGRLPDPAGE